jgi:hypothetical protein
MMRYFHQGRFPQQFRFLKYQFLRAGDLPFCNIPSEQAVSQVLRAMENVGQNGERRLNCYESSY